MSEDRTEIQEFPSIEGFSITQMLSEKGGMADVYLANQHGNDRVVILKCLRENDPNYIKRFRKEAKDHSKIDHPNVVTIYTVQEAGDRLFIAMEFMQGGDLSDAIKRGISNDQIIRTLQGVASALAATHELGIIHRDIKPENILFKSDGTAKLSDFGIARTIDGEGLTQANTCIGTPKYMSPEQLKGLSIDGRSDLYSLGLVLYEMLTRKQAFDGDTMESIFFQKVNQTELKLPKGMRHWQPILNKLVAPKPEDRYQEASELLKDLENINVNGASASAQRKSKIRTRLYIGLTTISALIGLGFDLTKNLTIDSTDDSVVIAKTDLGISSKLLVPYDHQECDTNVPGGIDLVPYLGEPLYENNCFGMSTKWNGSGSYYLISDVSGEGLWARMYPNECGNLGLPAELPVDTTVFMPSRNQQPWFYKLDSNARQFQFVSLAIEKNESDPDIVSSLEQLPSICNVTADTPAGVFDWTGFKTKLKLDATTANLVFEEMSVNHSPLIQ